MSAHTAKPTGGNDAAMTDLLAKILTELNQMKLRNSQLVQKVG